MGVDKDIATGIFATIEAANILPVVWPNVVYTDPVPYMQVWLMPTSTADYGLSSAVIRNGLVHVNIVIDSNIGMIQAIDYAEQVINLFPVNSIITENSTKIRFTDSGHIGSFLQTETMMVLPIDIPYKVLR